MARTLFTISPQLFPLGETVSPLVNLHQQFIQIVVFIDVPAPDATVNYSLNFEMTTDGTTFQQLFATTGNFPMLDQHGNILPFYTFTFALSGPGGVITFARNNQYRARLNLNKAFTLGFRIGGDS